MAENKNYTDYYDNLALINNGTFGCIYSAKEKGTQKRI